MIIILIRHAESIKNINKTFSSEGNLEKITEKGIIQTENIIKHLETFLKNNNLKLNNIYAAKSERASATAEVFNQKFNVNIEYCNEFLSITSDKELLGKSEEQVKESNPKFIHELSLYRAGLFNAYNYTSVAKVLKDGSYEKQIQNKINEIYTNNSNQCCIMIMHHSALTAAMINFARIGYNYPKDFYGNVDSDLGNLFLIKYDQEQCEILLVNSNPENIIDIIL